MAKNPNKRVWCVLVKGLRLKAKTTVGTETTRWVSDRSIRLVGPKRPVTDVLGCSNRERNYSRPKRPFFVDRFARLEPEVEKKSGKPCYPEIVV